MNITKRNSLIVYVVFSTVLASYFVWTFSQIGVLLLLPLTLLLCSHHKTSFVRLEVISMLLCSALLLLLTFYINDVKTLLSISIMIVCILAISLAAKRVAEPGTVSLETVAIVSEYLFYSSLVLSTIGTGLNLENAPSFFPWEALTGERRLILLTSMEVGHSLTLWLNALALVGRITRSREDVIKPFNVAVIMFLIITLYLTKARISLLILYFVFAGIMLRIVPLQPKLRSIAVVAAAWMYFIVYFLLQFNPNYQVALSVAAMNVQRSVPAVRVLSENKKSEVFATRDILNRELAVLSQEQPFTGVGASHSFFVYGPDLEGAKAKFRVVNGQVQRIGGSESPLRLVAKLGVPIGILFLALLLKASRSSLHLGNSLLASLSISMIVLTMASEATFENMFSLGGYFFFICLIIIESRRKLTRCEDLKCLVNKSLVS